MYLLILLICLVSSNVDEKIHKLQQDELPVATANLKELQSEIRKTRDKQKREILEQKIQEIQIKIKKINEGIWIPTLNIDELKVGEIGYLPKERTVPTSIGFRYPVLSVLDDGVLISPNFYCESPAIVKGRWEMKGYDLQKSPFILRIKTNGIVDGQELLLSNKPIEVFGTEQYESVGSGIVTVFALRYIELKSQKPEVKEVKEVKEINKKRVWKDVSGQFSITATFRGVIAGNVQLEKEDGIKVSVPIEHLSEECKKWIDEFISKH